MNEYFIKLYKYNLWANQTLVNEIKPYYNSNNYISETFSHVINAQYIWWGRINHDQPTPYKVREIQDYEVIQKNISIIGEKWQNYVTNINQAEKERVISYTNSFGESFTSFIQDVIIHLVNHSSYHRAQVARALRLENVSPPNTDYITYCRLLESGKIS